MNTNLELGNVIWAKVEKLTKAGFKITLDGWQAYCPSSQFSNYLDAGLKAREFVGSYYEFRIIKLVLESKYVVLSRTALQKIPSEWDLDNLDDFKEKYYEEIVEAVFEQWDYGKNVVDYEDRVMKSLYRGDADGHGF